MVSAFAQKGKKQAYFGFNTTKELSLAGTTAGTDYVAKEFSEAAK